MQHSELDTALIPFNRAKTEEQARRHRSYDDLATLSRLVIKFYNDSSYASSSPADMDELKAKIIDSIQADIRINDLATEEMSEFAKEKNITLSWALRTNKINLYSNGAIDFIKQHYIDILTKPVTEYLAMQREKHSIFGGSPTSTLGTSAPIFAIIALIRTLAVIHGIHKFSDLQSLLNNASGDHTLYHPKDSPNVHISEFPSGISFSETILNGFYYDKETMSTPGLLTITSGYIFGGSRDDYNAYPDKELRAQDCSSAVSYWTDSGDFSTSHMKDAALGIFTHDPEQTHSVLKNLQYVPHTWGTEYHMADRNPIHVGDIYVVRPHAGGGHTGIVSDIHPTIAEFTSLSINRNIPDVDGLGYNTITVDLNTRDYYFFRHTPSQPAPTQPTAHIPPDAEASMSAAPSSLGL